MTSPGGLGGGGGGGGGGTICHDPRRLGGEVCTTPRGLEEGSVHHVP